MATNPPERDSMAAGISPTCPAPTRAILQAAWAHDLVSLKQLLDGPGKASCQDPVTGETPLHAVVRGDASQTAAAVDCMRELFFFGAIWNDVDDHNETPGCVADRLGRPELYELCMQAGVRAELLFGLLDGYEALSSGGSEAEDEDMEAEMEMDGENGIEDFEKQLEAIAAAGDDEAPQLVAVNGEAEPAENGQEGVNGEGHAEVEQSEEREKEAQEEEEEPAFIPPKHDAAHDVDSESYLNSKLTYSDGKLVDDAGNGVMMAWETDIMRRSVDALLRPRGSGGGEGEEGKEEASSLSQGRRILNVGFGMGIIDSMFAAAKPARHHIIEAHPEVLAHIAESPESKFGPTWAASGTEPGAYEVLGGRWQEVVPLLLERGEVYDAIYFDTFGEDYGQLRNFSTEYIPGLLDQNGVFGFFNGLGADRKICYDVYTRVSEMHLSDAGLDVEWVNVDVDMKGMDEADKGEWEGVKRRYWTLDKYRLPLCTFMG